MWDISVINNNWEMKMYIITIIFIFIILNNLLNIILKIIQLIIIIFY
jgi:hypothetical protein